MPLATNSNTRGCYFLRALKKLEERERGREGGRKGRREDRKGTGEVNIEFNHQRHKSCRVYVLYILWYTSTLCNKKYMKCREGQWEGLLHFTTLIECRNL